MGLEKQGKPKKGFAKKHDIIFFSKDKQQICFRKIAITPSDLVDITKRRKNRLKYQIDGKTLYLDELGKSKKKIVRLLENM